MARLVLSIVQHIETKNIFMIHDPLLLNHIHVNENGMKF